MNVKLEETINGDLRDEDYNLGHFFMDYMTRFPEDCVWQIDAGTGETESKLSVKSRSIRLARALRNAGLRPGDVAVVSGRNHLDVHIPFYAAYMIGLPLAGIDPIYKYEEIKNNFQTTKPKIIFCEVDNFGEINKAVSDLGLDTKVVTFGDGDHSLAKFLKMHDDNTPEHAFIVETFDTDKVFAWLVSTSGTTGLPKVAAFKHSTIEVRTAFNLSSVQWMSSYIASLAMIIANHIKVQSSSPISIEHAIDIINKYRLVDTKTGEVITEPHKTGELWYKGPTFAEYYNHPEATAQAFTPDGWYKTGDLLYKDENGHYFVIDRMSNAFKVRRYYVMPMEVEAVILTHPGVAEACVVGVPHAEDGSRAVAVVQRRASAAFGEQDIKDLVASKLSANKHLHGGVIFVDHFPRTVSGKIIRQKVRDMVLRDQNTCL